MLSHGESGMRFIRPRDLHVPRAEADPRNQELISAISLEDIHPAPWQPRHHFDEGELTALAEAMRPGLLHPIVVRKRPDEAGSWSGHYELIVGERRLRAAKLNAARSGGGAVRIAARVVTVDDAAARRMTLVENEARCDKAPWEVAVAYLELRSALERERSASVTQAELASMTPHAVSTVSEYLLIGEVLTEGEFRDAGYLAEDGETDFRAIAELSRKQLLRASRCRDQESRRHLLSGARQAQAPARRSVRRSPEDREVSAFLRTLLPGVQLAEIELAAVELSRAAKSEAARILVIALEALQEAEGASHS